MPKALRSPASRLAAIAALHLFGVLGVIAPAYAQAPPMTERMKAGLNKIGQRAGFIPPGGKARDFVQILGAYANGLLAILGLLFMILIIYGGVLWMTAGGDETKVTSAKLRIKNAIFGLGIVLLARIFTEFYFSFLAPAVTPR